MAMDTDTQTRKVWIAGGIKVKRCRKGYEDINGSCIIENPEWRCSVMVKSELINNTSSIKKIETDENLKGKKIKIHSYLFAKSPMDTDNKIYKLSGRRYFLWAGIGYVQELENGEWIDTQGARPYGWKVKR